MIKTYRHLNFFQHESQLQVRTQRVKLPNGHVLLVDPEFAGRLSGLTLLFKAPILMLARHIPFAAVARFVGESAHRATAICERYVELALETVDFNGVRSLAIDETSRARGHGHITLAADAVAGRLLGVVEGRNARAIGNIADDLAAHQ